MSFFAELKRRNVYKVAVAYAVVGWLVIQICSTVLPTFHAPEWVNQTLIVLVAVGFPIALVLAWAFELTPEGIKPTEDLPGHISTVAQRVEKAHLDLRHSHRRGFVSRIIFCRSLRRAAEHSFDFRFPGREIHRSAAI